MKLGIMQPYFFPYIGYFELINRTDRWIVFDTPQYVRKSWMNRNRVLHPTSGWIYLTAPVVKQPQETPICDIRVQPGREWRETILRQLEHYRRQAPFFTQTLEVVRHSLDSDDESLSKISVRGLEAFCSYIEIPFKYEFHSELDLALGAIQGPGDWSLRISEALGAKEYINAPGGVSFFDREKFESAGIKLTFQELADLPYSKGSYTFEPYLSIIDVCMWNSPAEIRAFLDGHAAREQAA
ncbi:MAG: WbqC family protein [Fimbriimonadaceae bacterium]